MSYTLQFDWQAGRSIQQPCPACSAEGPHPHRVTSHTPASPVDRADYHTCRGCGSVFAAAFAYPDYGEDYDFADYLRFYLELGAGLEAMIAPLERALAARPARTLIDVGSGVPFVADFARRQAGLAAVALDPSNYAREGARALGLEVSPHLLGAGSPFDDQTFDIVYASEVIEHVDDPGEFLKTLAAHLAEDGVLVLTTPNAANLSPATNPLTNISIVWPGIHHVLFTPDSLRAAIRAAGLTHVEIATDTGHLVALASRTPMHWPDPLPASRLDAYLEYPPGNTAALRGGNLFRRLRQAVGFGHWETASDLTCELEARIREDYGWDVRDHGRFLDAVRTKDAPAVFAGFPYFAACLPFYLAMIDFQHRPGRRDRARAGFEAQLTIGETLKGGDPLWWGETAHLDQPARFNLGMTCLIDGDADAAITHLQRVGETPPAGTLASLGRRSASLSVQAELQCAAALHKAGQTDAARDLFAKTRDRISTDPDMQALQSIAEAIGQRLG
jgi:SAM-dependent methyltransferase